MSKNQLGMTLIEITLVMVIAASLILLGFQQYQQFRDDQSFIDIKRNADVLFQGLGFYYQANCRTLTDQAVVGPSKAHYLVGDLAPGGAAKVQYDASNAPFTIDIASSLVAKNYLPSNWPTYSPWIDTSGGYQGYTAAFLFQLKTKYIYACWNYTGNNGDMTCTTEQFNPAWTPQSFVKQQIAFWTVIVAAHVYNDPDGSKTRALLGPTGATCVSDTATACNSSAGTPQFLIWQRTPLSNSPALADSWLLKPQSDAFNRQYTHDVMYEMATPNYATPGSSPTPGANDYYYLCGS